MTWSYTWTVSLTVKDPKSMREEVYVILRLSKYHDLRTTTLPIEIILSTCTSATCHTDVSWDHSLSPSSDATSPSLDLLLHAITTCLDLLVSPNHLQSLHIFARHLITGNLPLSFPSPFFYIFLKP